MRGARLGWAESSEAKLHYQLLRVVDATDDGEGLRLLIHARDIRHNFAAIGLDTDYEHVQEEDEDLCGPRTS